MGAEEQAPPPELAGAGALELLRSGVELAPAAGEGAPDSAQATRKCLPLDLGEHRRRLQSFRTHWWFNKPVGASPIECARRGWVNVGPDALECECCGEDLRVHREGETWLANGAPVSRTALEAPSAAAWAAALGGGHGPFCPWRSHEVGVGDASQLSDRELADAVEDRLRGLRTSLSWVPVLHEDGRKAEEADGRPQDALQALARAGWESAGRDPGGSDMMQCALCLRKLAVQCFSHLPAEACLPARAEGGEGAGADSEGPPKKAPRLLEEVALPQPRPPAPGLWTPCPPQFGSGRNGPGAAPAAASGVAAMDPYALHRFYCPLYARADDDLGPTAARVIRAHVEAAGAARGAEAAGAGAEGAAAAAAGSSAVARAEELLRALGELLPPA